MSFINLERRRNTVEEPDQYILNKYVKIFRLGQSGTWMCELCRRKDDLPHMKKHHMLEQWPCYQKWKKIEWEEENKDKPKSKFKTDENNSSLDAFTSK